MADPTLLTFAIMWDGRIEVHPDVDLAADNTIAVAVKSRFDGSEWDISAADAALLKTFLGRRNVNVIAHPDPDTNIVLAQALAVVTELTDTRVGEAIEAAGSAMGSRDIERLVSLAYRIRRLMRVPIADDLDGEDFDVRA